MNTKLITHICFFTVLLLSFLTMIYVQQYDVVSHHDLYIAFGRNFMEPEHGRYIATFLNNLFHERLPELFGIHQNDFKPLVIVPFKSLVSILIFLFLANTVFLFQKKEQNKLFKFDFSNLAFMFTYVLIFLILFKNNNETLPLILQADYFNIFETTAFLEYIMILVVYVPFISVLSYLFVKNEKPSVPNHFLLMFSAFLIGLSVEAIILPLFLFLSLMFIYLFFDYVKNQNSLFKSYLSVYLTYIIAIVIYFVTPNDHPFFYADTVNGLLSVNYADFVTAYLTRYGKSMFFIFIPLALMLSFSVFCKNKSDAKRYMTLIVLGIVSVNIYYLFFLSGDFIYGEMWFITLTWLRYNVWFQVTYIFLYLFSISYFFDSCLKLNDKRSEFLKTLMIVTVITVFNQNLIADGVRDLKERRDYLHNLRKVAYLAEKAATTTESGTVNLPGKLLDYDSVFLFSFKHEGEPITKYCCWLNNVYYQSKHFEKIEFDDNSDTKYSLTEDELKKLRFQKFLPPNRKRHKRNQKQLW